VGDEKRIRRDGKRKTQREREKPKKCMETLMFVLVELRFELTCKVRALPFEPCLKTAMPVSMRNFLSFKKKKKS
jgi:hypothetical protein